MMDFNELLNKISNLDDSYLDLELIDFLRRGGK